MSSLEEVSGSYAEAMSYKSDTREFKQKHLIGRRGLLPNVDLSAYRFRSKIDTLIVEAAFAPCGHPRFLAARLASALGVKTPWVNIDKKHSNSAMCFADITLQDVPRDRLSLLIEYREFFYDPSIKEIHVAVDVQSRLTDPVTFDCANQEVLGVIVRHLWADRSIIETGLGRPRLVWGCWKSGRSFVEPMTEATSRVGGSSPALIPENCTVYLGARHDDVSYRLYYKRTDLLREGEDPALLPPDQWSARCEVVLRKQALEQLGISEARKLATFNFGRLKRFFRFQLPTFRYGMVEDVIRRMARSARDKMAFDRFMLGGMSHYRQFERGLDPRSEYGYSVAYPHLNERFRDALRRLR